MRIWGQNASRNHLWARCGVRRGPRRAGDRGDFVIRPDQGSVVPEAAPPYPAPAKAQASSLRMSVMPPAYPGRGGPGSGAGSFDGVFTGWGSDGKSGSGSVSASGGKTSDSAAPLISFSNWSASIVSRTSRISEIRVRSSRRSSRMSRAVWWAPSTIRRISSSISRAISSE